MGLGSETWFGWSGDLEGLGDFQKRRGYLLVLAWRLTQAQQAQPRCPILLADLGGLMKLSPWALQRDPLEGTREKQGLVFVPSHFT